MGPQKGHFRPAIVLSILAVHLVAAYGVWWCLTWGVAVTAWVFAVVLYAVASLGITVGYHRYFTHGAFRCRDGLQRVLASAGALAVEGTLNRWVTDHRQHHRFTEEAFDPHTPHAYRQPFGFLWAHLGWLFWETRRPPTYEPAIPYYLRDVFAWQERRYWYIVLAGFIVPFMIAGWGGLFLAGFIRVVVHWHVTWSVNSVCHLWGTRPLRRDGEVWRADESRNNWLVAFLGMGEGWHGNHHVRPNSAELGYRWYDWDPGKWLIHFFRLGRVAHDVKPYIHA